MSNTAAFGKKAFTTAVVGATILWSVGFSALAPLAAQGATGGDLIKGSLPAVYYYGADGKRYVFPNEKTYKTWYSDFSGVKTISDSELAAITIGGNATYRATAATMWAVKVTTSPTVYAVSNGGELRAIPDEATAAALLGSDWNKKISDVPDAFFTNYHVGAALAVGATLSSLPAASASIGADKSLVAGATTPSTTAGALALSAAADSPAAASAPYSAGEVIFAKVTLTGAGSVTKVKVMRSGLSADADLSSVKLFDGVNQLGTNQSFDSNHQATFVLTTPWEVSGSKTLTIAADIAAAGTANAGNSVQLGIAAAADVTLASGSVSGTFPIRGNAMTISSATIGTLTIANTGGQNPTTDPGVDAGNPSPLILLEARLSAGTTEDVQVTRFATQKAGTHISTDIGALELYDATNAKVLGTVTGWNSDSRAIFDLSAAPITLLKGGSVNLQVRVPAGKILAGSARTVSAKLEKSGSTFTGVSARGTTYNLGLVPDDGATNWDGTATAQTINAGSFSITKSTSTPATGNVAPGAQNLKVASWDVTIKGEDLRSTSTTFALALGGGMVRTDVTACILRDSAGAAVAGPVDATATPAVVFSTTVTFPVGTKTYSLHCNLNQSLTGTQTIAASIAPSTTTLTLTGVSSGNSVANAQINSASATAVSGNTLTVKAAGLTITNLGTPAASTVVQGAQNTHTASVNLSASASSSGEDVRITSVKITDTTSATADGDDIINLRLAKDDGTTLLADIKQPSGSNAAGDDPTYTFTLTSPLVVTRTADTTIRVVVDVKANMAGTAGATHTFSVVAVGDVVATGVTTGTTLAAGAKALNAAGQALTLQTAGTITPSLDASSPVSGLLVAGRSGVIVSAFKLVGANENVQVRKVKITRTSTAGRDADLAKVYLYEGDTKLGEAVLSSAVATFDLSSANFVVDRLGNPRRLTVKVDLNTVLSGAVSGEDLRFDFTGLAADADGAPLGLSSGNGVIIATVTSNAHYVRRSMPTFTKNVSNTTVLVPGTQDAFLLDISAAPEADVVFRAGATDGTYVAAEGMLRFAVTKSGNLTGGTASLIRKSTNTTLSTHAFVNGDTHLLFNFKVAALTVGAGKTETVIVRVDTSGLTTSGNTYQLTLTADTATTVSTAANVNADAAAADHLRWNDDVTGDDYNGFGVTSLPISNALVKG